MANDQDFDDDDFEDDDEEDNIIPWKSGGSNSGTFFFGNILLGLLLIILALSGWVWFYWRIEPTAGQIAVLTHKTGQDLLSGKIIATEENEKGIKLDVLSEGRYFRNPYTWGWSLHQITDIPAGQLGIMIRLYGENLLPGQILAREGEKGILKDVLRPGKYRINPYAYEVHLSKAIMIRPGHVGIVTSITGKDTLFTPYADSQNSFLIKNGEKGILKQVLDPGTYYLNPFVYKVDEVSLQSQRFQMSGKDSITFLSFDGFNIVIEGTIEWAIKRDAAAMITVRVGDLEDILEKVILPHARGFSRIEGSKKYAVEYIAGQTRQEFQNNLFKHLKKICEERGVIIYSTLIRNIRPPDGISSLKRIREVAVQDRHKYVQEIEEAKSRAELAKQQELAIQNREKVEQNTKKIKALIAAEQIQAVSLTNANRNLEVSKINLDAAKYQAAAKIAKAKAEHDVILYKFDAQAKVLTDYVNAFESGWNYTEYSFLNKIGPNIQYIIGEEEGVFGRLFEKYTRRAN